MNERFIYMPSIGFCLIVAWLLCRKLPALKMEILSWGLLAIISLGYAVKTISRVPVWESALTLNSAAIQVSENSARANTFFGTSLFNQYRVEQDQARYSDQLDLAYFYFSRAIDIHPDYFSALTMKSGVIAEQHKRNGNLDQLLNGFYELLMIRSNLPFISEYMDYIKGRNDQAKILQWCHRVGTAFTQRGDWNSALKWLTFGLELSPNNKQILMDMGAVYEAAGNPNNAQEYFDRAR